MAYEAPPLNAASPIVDANGFPTPEFMRAWGAQRDVNSAAIDLDSPQTLSNKTLDATNSAPWSILTGTPTTLAGYGISDTKANFDTALSDGTFVFTGDSIPWSTITTTPTTLAGYGITDGVDTSSSQNVGGTKTFTTGIAVKDSGLSIYQSAAPTNAATFNVGVLTAARTYYLPDNSSQLLTSNSTAPVANKTLDATNSAPWSILTGTPTTLAGYGISDTKANFDTALSDGTFVFTGDSIPWSTITTTPTTLAGYGITDAVDMSSDQSVFGAKRFSSYLLANNGVAENRANMAPYSSSATLAASDLTRAAIPVNASSAVTLTMPLATALVTQFPSALTNDCMDFSIINEGTAGVTLATNTGVTPIYGSTSVPAGTSAMFRIRLKADLATWVVYRIA